MSAGLESRIVIGVACVASVLAVGSLLMSNAKPIELSVQASQVTPTVSAPTVTQPVPLRPLEEPEQQLESIPLASVEEQLEDIGEVVSTMSKAALPAFAAFFAVVAGFLLRKLSANQLTNTLKPMEMAADEETPLTRRGVLTALATFPIVAASPAFAAKTGGRIGGGSGFRSFSSRAKPVAPPVTGGMGGAAVGGVTRGGAVYVAPSPPVIIGPPVVASPFGYGYGYGVGFGFSTGELLALSALELGEAFVREQRRQEFIRQQLETQRKLGQDEAQIQALQQQLAEQEKMMRELQDVMRSKGVTAPAQ